MASEQRIPSFASNQTFPKVVLDIIQGQKFTTEHQRYKRLRLGNNFYEDVDVTPPIHNNNTNSFTTPLRHTEDSPAIVQDENIHDTEIITADISAQSDRLGAPKSSYSTDSRPSYNHQQTRKRLLRTGFSRLSITVAFCLLIGVCLKAYEGFEHENPRVLKKSDVSAMNGILLALSLGLGLNIASSLRHYSSTLRWAILTRKYVSLGEFDLILGCESLANVFKLMVISLPRSEKLPLTRALSGFERTRNRISQKSTSRYTSILCMSWLLINVGAQVLVAALSLFWPVTPSQAIPLTTRGIVSVANIANFDHLTDIYKVATERASSNTYGITGLEYPVFEYPLNSSKQELAALFRTVIYKRSGGYEYNFLNRNSDQPNAQYLVSPRNISVNTECTPVMTEPTYEMPQNSTVKFRYNGTWYKYPMNSIVSGSISWNVKSNNACGPRCMEIVAYQRADPELGIMTNSMFICNNTVSSIEQIQEFDKLEKEQLKYIYSTDSFARVAAGSIGWTGWRRGNRTVETRVYPLGSATSPTYPVNAGDIENIVSRFTIGAIAAFDDHGPRYNIPNQKNRPVLGLRLNAEWSCILALLGGICGLQLGALTALLAFANKSIIRDESLFSLARLLVPVVSRIPEDEGTNMKGDYIMNHPNLVGQKIRYGYEEEKDGSRKVAISFLFQGMSARSSIRSFPDGMYK